MAAPGVVVDRRGPVGRAGEIDALLRLCAAAADGRAGTALVAGEAGVGKTVLVREVVSRLPDDVDVLWASCLPLTTLAIPLLPLTTALRRWAADSHADVPALSTSGAPDASAPAVAIDEWLDRRCAHRPLVLVVDDLHWADASTLDALLFVVSGPRDRRLATLCTIRSEAVPESPAVRRWLADVRRLPDVVDLPVGRLDRASTAEQIHQLIEGPPHESLVDATYARSHGNAYLTSLLVRGLPADATGLGDDLPVELREALARSWHGLSAPARQVTRLLAVAGRPESTESLTRVADAAGVSAALDSLLDEAAELGVTERRGDGSSWFVHPLMPEVLVAGMSRADLRRLHTRFAEVLERELADVPDAATDDVIRLADHEHLAGRRAEAYEWAVRGAEAAERDGAPKEAIRLLGRAADLVGDDDVSALRDVQERIRRAADAAGEYEAEFAAVETLLALIDRDVEPLTVAALLVRRSLLLHTTGRAFSLTDDSREAVRLSQVAPSSAEHALALAELVRTGFWRGDPGLEVLTEQAVSAAQASGDPRAVAFALVSRVMVSLTEGADADPRAQAAAKQAYAAATQARDPWAHGHATAWLGNSLDVYWADEVIEIYLRARRDLQAWGAAHTYVALAANRAAKGLIVRGRWREAQALLREAMGSTPGPLSDVEARLASAVLACRQGRQHEADQHLLRADEVFAESTSFATLGFEAARAEVALVRGELDDAVAITQRVLETMGTPVTDCERLVPMAARALADRAQRARDTGGDVDQCVRSIRDLEERFPQIVPDVQPGATYAAAVDAMNALYAAELLRGLDEPTAYDAWQDAVKLCDRAQLPWDEAYTAFRAAEAGLRGREHREAGASTLRRAHALATDLQMLPLLAEIEALGRSTRVSLARPRDVDPGSVEIRGLTPREREILAHVVAGRTYGEIAKALFISEKTVSVHVSNLLRKTGTTNRVELAQLAIRMAGDISQVAP